ncbi:hypothetical protein GSI_14293 [Ganoderma sinense ZZ0214-1]|uniref:Uncharacterized protein n=1 Tax=Ganoderma sinense ZZ0214-1 TaxID=1077348 RepID=A0A2G8RSP8_9APHY|nr:hypothetical protein GSI_14293 [Ganoderma sinense ZZ0214-1]
MPVYRSTNRAATTPSRTTESHSSLLVELRSRIRKLMNQNLSAYLLCPPGNSGSPRLAEDLTGNRKARMRWSPRGYARHVIIRGGKILKGWPTYAGVPFGNLSDVPGGQPVMELLLSLWTSGTLRFEDASEDEVDLAVWNPAAVLPGAPLATPKPAAVESIEGAEDSEDPIEDAVWPSEVEGEASEIDESTD